MYPIVLNAEFGRYHLTQGCPTRGPGGAMRPAWSLGAAHYSFSLQVVFFSKIVTISSKRVERA